MKGKHGSLIKKCDDLETNINKSLSFKEGKELDFALLSYLKKEFDCEVVETSNNHLNMKSVLKSMDDEGVCFVVFIGDNAEEMFIQSRKAIDGFLYINEHMPIVVQKNHVQFFVRNISHIRRYLQEISMKGISVISFYNHRVDYYFKNKLKIVFDPKLFVDYYYKTLQSKLYIVHTHTLNGLLELVKTINEGHYYLLKAHEDCNFVKSLGGLLLKSEGTEVYNETIKRNLLELIHVMDRYAFSEIKDTTYAYMIHQMK